MTLNKARVCRALFLQRKWGLGQFTRVDKDEYLVFAVRKFQRFKAGDSRFIDFSQSVLWSPLLQEFLATLRDKSFRAGFRIGHCFGHRPQLDVVSQS